MSLITLSESDNSAPMNFEVISNILWSDAKVRLSLLCNRITISSAQWPTEDHFRIIGFHY